MRRFFGKRKNEKYFLIEGDEFYHLSKVLRAKEGEKIIVCSGDDYEHICTIEQMGKKDCHCLIEQTTLCPANPKKEIVLFQALPKKEYLDNIIPKAIELGVHKIVLYLIDHCAVKDIKRARVDQQVLSACKQCERSKLVEVTDPMPFKNMLKSLDEFEVVLFANEKERSKKFDPNMVKNKNKIAVIVGCEGGFTKEEIAEIEKHATSITLGSRILRTDTASLVMVALASLFSDN